MDLTTEVEINADMAGPQIFENCLTGLTAEYHKLLDEDYQNNKTIKDLKVQPEELETKYIKLNGCSRQIICLIDGDGTIFLPDIIALGKKGGCIAAIKLSDIIKGHLSSLGENQLWIYIFCNLSGLAATLRKYSHLKEEQVQDFVRGFNETSDGFIMVDVGNGKEGDAKLKAHLEKDIHSPEVSKIIFAGCHDTSYATTINSIVINGLYDRLILLRGYTKMAPAVEELALRLPCISTPVTPLDYTETAASEAKAEYLLTLARTDCADDCIFLPDGDAPPTSSKGRSSGTNASGSQPPAKAYAARDRTELYVDHPVDRSSHIKDKQDKKRGRSVPQADGPGCCGCCVIQ